MLFGACLTEVDPALCLISYSLLLSICRMYRIIILGRYRASQLLSTRPPQQLTPASLPLPLYSGTFLYFLFGWLLLLLITCMFLLGGLSQLYLCDGLVDPSAPGSGLPILEAVYPLERVSPALQNAGDVADVVR